MALVSTNVHHLFPTRWENEKQAYMPIPAPKLNPEHTYFVVFNRDQSTKEEQFKKEYGHLVIFEGERACNKNYKNGPRNKLYIFETK